MIPKVNSTIKFVPLQTVLVTKNGSRNINFNSEGDVSTRCSSLLYSESEVSVRTPAI